MSVCLAAQMQWSPPHAGGCAFQRARSEASLRLRMKCEWLHWIFKAPMISLDFLFLVGGAGGRFITGLVGFGGGEHITSQTAKTFRPDGRWKVVQRSRSSPAPPTPLRSRSDAHPPLPSLPQGRVERRGRGGRRGVGHYGVGEGHKGPHLTAHTTPLWPTPPNGHNGPHTP